MDLNQKLISYLQDAHAMETNARSMLDSMLETTSDPEMRKEIEHHQMETERHESLLRQRLEALGQSTSTVKEAGSIMGALMKGVVDQVRSDKAGKNARDGYVTEHMEIAAYELLERLARRAGDEETAEIARKNRADEEAMAKKIAGRWDKVLDLSLAEEGLRA